MVENQETQSSITSLFAHPREQKQVIGHMSQKERTQQYYRSNKFPHGLILLGPRGVGKATFAWEIAKYLLSRKESTSFNGNENVDHSKLIAAGTHPDLFFLEAVEKENASKTISVDLVRALQNFTSRTPVKSDCKIVIVDDIGNLSKHGNNALLKGIEEPSGETFFLLVAHDAASIIQTIRSRCQIMRFNHLKNDDMLLFSGYKELSVLEKAFVNGSPGRLINVQSDNGIRRVYDCVVKLLDELLTVGDFSLEQLSSLSKIAKESPWFTEIMTEILQECLRLAYGVAERIPLQDLSKKIKVYPIENWFKLWDNWRRLVPEAKSLSLDWFQLLLIVFHPLILKKV